MNLSLEPIYVVIGLFVISLGVKQIYQGRFFRGLFWTALGGLFAASSLPGLPNEIIGMAVIGIAALAFFANSERHEEDENLLLDRSWHFKAKLVRPAIMLPLLTLAMTLLLRWAQQKNWLQFNLDQAALYGLFLALIISLLYAMLTLGVSFRDAIGNGNNVLNQIGWPIFLPLLLAMLGSIYTSAGVGAEVSKYLPNLIRTDDRYVCIAIYGVSMALFTMMVGNAFAAFPVITVAIGIPLVVDTHHGDPIAMASMGMLCGYCGTLLTPLAANFNLVPAALLGLDDRWAVIKAQWRTAVLLLAGNIGLMCLLVYR